jgi:hypothetical protein
MCAVALIGLIIFFKEVGPGAPGASREPAARLPLRDLLRHPNFLAVLAMLLVAQFLDRGLALLIPLQVAHMPGVVAIAATSGTIISVAAVAATVSANLAARLSRDVPAARLLMIGFLVGGRSAPHGLPRAGFRCSCCACSPVCLGSAITLRGASSAQRPRRGLRLVSPWASGGDGG